MVSRSAVLAQKPTFARRATAGKLRIHIRQSGVIQDLGRGVANLLHRESHAARLFVEAFRAPHVRGLAHARHSSERPIEYANHFGECNLGRIATEKIPSTFALLAFDQALALQVEKDGFQKLLGESLTCSEVGDEDGPLAGFSRQHQQSLQRIARPVR